MILLKRLILIIAIGSHAVMAQNDGIEIRTENEFIAIGEVKPKHTFNMVIGLPNATINKPFESIMRGIVDVNPYYQYHLDNGLGFGVGLRWTHFSINEFRVPEPLDGVMNTFGGFVKIGHEKFYSTRFAMDFALKVGYNYYAVKTDLNTLKRGGDYTFDAGFVEPLVGFIVTATEHSSFRLTVGYTFQAFKFHPSKLGTEMNGGWEPKEFDKSAQFLTFGLGYTYYFGNNKK